MAICPLTSYDRRIFHLQISVSLKSGVVSEIIYQAICMIKLTEIKIDMHILKR